MTPPVQVAPAGPPATAPNRRRLVGIIAGGILGLCILCGIFFAWYSGSPEYRAALATQTARAIPAQTAEAAAKTIAAQPKPSATPKPTDAPKPSATPRPTEAPRPTNPARPTATIPATATPRPTATPWVPPTCVPGVRLGATCKDGYKDEEHTGSGACSGHGGVAAWIVCPSP